MKKFISAGTHADYFTVAARTGGQGMAGISLILVERTRPGVEARRMQMQGWWTSGTALVALDEVKVPVSNLIGKENDGFKPIMYGCMFVGREWCGVVWCGVVWCGVVSCEL